MLGLRQMPRPQRFCSGLDSPAEGDPGADGALLSDSEEEHLGGWVGLSQSREAGPVTLEQVGRLLLPTASVSGVEIL
jgi:hypothetical protein